VVAGGGRPAQAWGAEGGSKGKQKGGPAVPAVRYHNGAVVSRKWEKYVVTDEAEAWDGGSKGKVFTEGKRGKGVVGN